MLTVADVIRGHMRQHHLTQERLADLVGLSRRTVGQLLLELRIVTPGTALRLGRLFGFEPKLLLDVQAIGQIEAARRCYAKELAAIVPLTDPEPPSPG